MPTPRNSPTSPTDSVLVDLAMFNEWAIDVSEGIASGGGAGVSPDTVYEALLPLGKLSDEDSPFYTNIVTLYSPDVTDVEDGAYVMYRLPASDNIEQQTAMIQFSNGNQTDGEVFCGWDITDGRAFGGTNVAQSTAASENFDYSQGFYARSYAESRATTSVLGEAYHRASSYGSAVAEVRVTHEKAELHIVAEAGQTAPLFNLTGKPTGVAVSTAGIHAALVTLGLITA